MSQSNIFDSETPLPDQRLTAKQSTLLGFDARFGRVRDQLRLLLGIGELGAWNRKHHGGKLALCDLVTEQYPLLIFHGDVGTGKTAIRAASDAPAWKRSGNLQRGLKPLYPGLRTGIVDIQGTPAEKYAEARHNLNKPGALGIVRHDPFFENTERIIEPQAPQVFENAFLNELDI